LDNSSKNLFLDDLLSAAQVHLIQPVDVSILVFCVDCNPVNLNDFHLASVALVAAAIKEAAAVLDNVSYREDLVEGFNLGLIGFDQFHGVVLFDCSYILKTLVGQLK
jgi:hypothetical protein